MGLKARKNTTHSYELCFAPYVLQAPHPLHPNNLDLVPLYCGCAYRIRLLGDSPHPPCKGFPKLPHSRCAAICAA